MRGLAQLGPRLRSSLWVPPTIGLGAAVLGAVLSIAIDRRIPPEHSWLLFSGAAESARELVSTITSSILQFLALVFSVTVLVLQLASNQFSPRVIRTFLEERVTRWALAIFVATFAYAIIVLAQVRAAPTVFVPAISIWIAFVLTLASIGVFIAYIHHMAHSIRAISIIARISQETRRAIDRVFPDRGTESGATAPRAPAAARAVRHEGAPGVLVRLDVDALLAVACEAAGAIELEVAVGAFVPSGAVLFRITGDHPDIARAREAFDLDLERTIDQDPAFGLRQLVDIAVRALSAGVNDPTTAVQTLDHIHDLVRRITTRAMPASQRCDQDDQVRVVVRQPTFEELVGLAFDEIIHYGGDHPQVRTRLIDALRDCAALASPARRSVLEARLRRLGAEDDHRPAEGHEPSLAGGGRVSHVLGASTEPAST